jgi:transcriptional regulator with XRE-family HTH domain
MLPFYDRSVSVARKDVAPVWTRSFPIEKEPATLGQHLKKKRFMDGMRQKQTAAKLGVSARTLSQWECDRIVPAWGYQPRLIADLGHDPFIGLTPGRPKGNETSGVAFLSPECLDAGIAQIAIICVSEDRLQKIAAAVSGSLGAEAAAKVSYFQPDQFIARLKTLPPPQEAPVTNRGFKVKRSIPALTDAEQRQRENLANQMMAEAMQPSFKTPSKKTQ